MLNLFLILDYILRKFLIFLFLFGQTLFLRKLKKKLELCKNERGKGTNKEKKNKPKDIRYLI